MQSLADQPTLPQTYPADLDLRAQWIICQNGAVLVPGFNSPAAPRISRWRYRFERNHFIAKDRPSKPFVIGY